jgi:hypothetical protein
MNRELEKNSEKLKGYIVLISTIIYTALNSLKALHIDDTAYYIFANHIKNNPFDPYGFTFLWFNKPQEAITILAPPVFLYYFSLLIKVFNNNPVLWKIGCFPFYYLMSKSIYKLLRRFDKSLAEYGLILFVFSPVILPASNLMLDIPFISLFLFSWLLLLESLDSSSIKKLLLAGLLAGLSIQTKYNAFSILPLALITAFLYKNFKKGIYFCLIAIFTFIVIELLITQMSGQSHFLLQLQLKKGYNHYKMIFGFLGQLGAGGIGILLISIGYKKSGNKYIFISTAVIISLLLISLFIKPSYANNLYNLIFYTSGIIIIIFLFSIAYKSIKNYSLKNLLHCNLDNSYDRDIILLFSWIVGEVVLYFYTSPFPAMRRIIIIYVPSLLAATHFIGNNKGNFKEKKKLVYITAFVLFFSISIFSLDYQSAEGQKDNLNCALLKIKQYKYKGSVWYTGNWGFKYYAEQKGLKEIYPDETIVKKGELLIYPERGIHKPKLNIREDDWDIIAKCSISPYFNISTNRYYSGKIPMRRPDKPVYVVKILRSRYTQRVTLKNNKEK